jgi:RimJ/RimL family protein N-acetyltransferase
MLYSGLPLAEDTVALVAPALAALPVMSCADDVRSAVQEWSSRAETEHGVLYFWIQVGVEPVGQIFLHDIDEQAREALVGYHLFQQAWRGHGVGSRALVLLQHYVMKETTLGRLVLITSGDNIASRRAAEKAGFRATGSPREDPTGVLLEWSAPRHSGRAAV